MSCEQLRAYRVERRLCDPSAPCGSSHLPAACRTAAFGIDARRALVSVFVHWPACTSLVAFDTTTAVQPTLHVVLSLSLVARDVRASLSRISHAPVIMHLTVFCASAYRPPEPPDRGRSAAEGGRVCAGGEAFDSHHEGNGLWIFFSDVTLIAAITISDSVTWCLRHAKGPWPSRCRRLTR